LKRLLPLLLLLALPAAAAPVRVLVAVGDNLGDPEDAPLRWAEADAQRVVQVFVDIGDVAPERSLVVLGQGASVVRERLSEAVGRVRELAAQGNEIVFVVYLSAHAKDGELHLKGTRLKLTEVRELIEGAGAQLALVVVDACDSGAIARSKGGAPAPEYEVKLEAPTVKGEVFLTSSGPAEASQEWESLQGSLFTHYLLTGLRGDADTDADGKVSLAEAYAYTWRRTVSTAARAGQHPSFDVDLSGSGDVTLAMPMNARSAIVFPPGVKGRFTVVSQPRPDVVSEVDKVEGRPLRLAVPPGRYLVRKHLGAEVGLVSFELPYGGERVLDESQMEHRHFSEVALKGGYVELRPHAVTVQGAFENEQLSGNGGRWRAGAGYRYTWDTYWLQAAVGAGYRVSAAQQLTTRETQVGLTLMFGYRFLAHTVVPFAGLLGEARLLHQTYVRENEAQLEAAFNVGPVHPRDTLGFAAGLVGGVEVPLAERWFVSGSAAVTGRWLPAENQLPWTLGVEGVVSVGARW
jgi:hypothetical protein